MRYFLIVWLCWVSATVAQAQGKAPFVSHDHHFSAVFQGPVKVAHPRLNQVTYGRAPNDSARDWEAVSVLTGRLRKSPRDVLNYLVSEGVVKSHAGPVKDILLDKVAGIEMAGLDEKGIPFAIRVFTSSQATFVVMSCNIDLGVNRAFIQSFQLQPWAAPRPGATPAAKPAPR